jgi:hypothetical protein
VSLASAAGVLQAAMTATTVANMMILFMALNGWFAMVILRSISGSAFVHAEASSALI